MSNNHSQKINKKTKPDKLGEMLKYQLHLVKTVLMQEKGMVILTDAISNYEKINNFFHSDIPDKEFIISFIRWCLKRSNFGDDFIENAIIGKCLESKNPIFELSCEAVAASNVACTKVEHLIFHALKEIDQPKEANDYSHGDIERKKHIDWIIEKLDKNISEVASTTFEHTF